MNKLISSLILSVSILAMACDTIPEDKQFLAEKKSVEEIKMLGRSVLLEDYTGIWCTNCPRAAAAAHETQKILSKDVLVIVSIHAGVFSTNSPFNTSVGDEYQKRFYPENSAYPAGIISRTKFNNKLVNIQDDSWKTDILAMLFSEIPNVKLSLQNQYNDIDSTLTVTSSVVSNEKIEQELKLQLWLTESKIKHFQVNGTPKPNEYIHNHVLRDAINGVWGDTVQAKQGEKSVYTNTYSLKGKIWEPKNMDVVGFLYDAKTMQVLYVTEIKLINN
ncbi:MAG: Omp28 family outer membrane lipoprotein [Dysgonamonadaceae bacterium]|nr:Omp28 family outer membrane lipoprotein [Dysgonamonadaceae bacterium]